MKHIFIASLMYAPKATGGGKATTTTNDQPASAANPAEGQTPVATMPPAPEPTSDKLTELKAKKAEQWAELRKLENPDSNEYIALNLEMYKTGKAIEAEIAAIRKAEADAILAEKKNQRIALVDNFENALRAHLDYYNNVHAKLDDEAKVADIENVNKLGDAAKASREVIVNELLSRYASSTPAKATATGTPSEPRVGGKQAEIRELLLKYVGEGQTPTQAVKTVIDQHGHSRGTTGAVRTQMVKDGELVD